MNNYVINEKYITVKGDPVVYLGKTDNGEKMKLNVLVTGNDVTAPKNYKLLPYDENKINSMAKSLLRSYSTGKKSGSTNGKPKLAHKIDKYLFEGKHTVNQIADLIKDEPEAKGRDLRANVHARIVSYKRKNATVIKSKDGKVTVISKN